MDLATKAPHTLEGIFQEGAFQEQALDPQQEQHPREKEIAEDPMTGHLRRKNSSKDSSRSWEERGGRRLHGGQTTLTQKVPVSAAKPVFSRMPICEHMAESPECFQSFNPVCGTDGVTYKNECQLCSTRMKTKQDIQIIKDGKC